MSDKPTVATVNEIAKSAHKRIDAHGEELVLLREAKHKHAGMLQAHNGTLGTLKTSMDNLTSIIGKSVAGTAENTQTIRDFKVMMKVGVVVGGSLGSVIAVLLGYIGGNIQGWW